MKRITRFPFRAVSKDGENIEITRNIVEGKPIYTLRINGSQFVYSSKRLKDCLFYCHI